ncbi:hypothetical protein CDAR_5232 [Caerostris darwini]|uniref:Uncharacterized protein n=1 Tax=Caerostris darwini TaxID=1538125 RepID=A0AAV4P5F4_9ARAC|nr:hypothetical protein CDAR_5232 [Caerostris darwini]
MFTLACLGESQFELDFSEDITSVVTDSAKLKEPIKSNRNDTISLIRFIYFVKIVISRLLIFFYAEEVFPTMAWLIFLLFSSNIASMLGQTEINELNKEFEAELQEEALKVLRQHMNDMSQVPQAPSYNAPQTFMRSFIPGTGVGNREELIIDSINRVSALSNSNYTQWRYKRFNNTDYILGVKERSIVLYKFDSSSDDLLDFLQYPGIFNFNEGHWSVIKDVAIFTRSIKRTMALYVAILTEGPKTSLIHIYEIIRDQGISVSLIDLGITPSTGQLEVKKMAFVESQFGSSLVVLINNPNESKLIFQQRGSSELNHYIEVHYPEAVDLVTFTIHGHGYLAATSDTMCDIFKLDKYAQNYRHFDRISPPHGDLVDLEYFRLGFHHYLAVAGRSQQYLYIWKSGEFALTQAFNGYDVGQLYSSTLPTCRDDVILFLISDATVSVYVYNGKTDKFVSSDTAVPPAFLVSPGSVASYTHKSKLKLIFQNGEDLEAFIIETSLEPVRNPFLVAEENISNYMKRIQQMLENQATQLQNIKDVLNNAVRTNGDQYITAFQTFNKLHSIQEASVKIEQTTYVEWEDADLTLEQYRQGTEQLEARVTELETLVGDIQKVIPDIVRIDEDAEIIGRKVFVGDVSGSSISAYAVNLQTVAGINVTQLQKEIYRLDKPQKIQGTLTFEQPLRINGNLDIDGTINGIDISKDVMTTNTDQTSYANMIFKNKVIVQEDVIISGKVNDIDVSEEVVTLGGSHNITGLKNFQNGIVAGSVETMLLDGVDINFLVNNALTKSTDQEVFGVKTFSGGLVTSNIILKGYLNGYDVAELAKDIVRIDKPAVITGHKTFLQDVYMENTLTVDGTVNGLNIPDDLFLTDVAQTITGEKKFTGTVTAHNVIVEGTVDGLVIPGDIVTLSGDEEVSATLYFTEGINVEGSIVASGLVDGVNIVEVAKQALKSNETYTFKDAVFYGPVTITDNLIIGGTVNGIHMDKLVGDIVFNDDKDIVIESEKYFKKVVAKTVNLEHMISGYNITEDFMKVHGDQYISGTKTFKKPVTFKSITTKDGMIGGLNVTELYEQRIHLEIEDEIVHDVEFSDHVIVEDNLIVHGTVGGLRIPEDIVLKNSKTPISNKIFTKKVTVENLMVNGDAEVSGLFGGVNLTEFYHNRVTLSGEDVLEADVWIGNSTVETVEVSGLVNGVDIVEFANNVMSKTKEQEVFAEKIFTGDVIVEGPIITSEGINGVKLSDINDRAFKLSGENYVTEHFQFQDVTMDNIAVTGLINGLNLTYLAEDSLKKSYPHQHVTGLTTFESGFHVNGDIEADTVNGLYIPRDILLKSLPQTITGEFTVGTLNVAGDVHVEKLVNGLDLSEISSQIAQTEKETVIESDVTFLEPIHISEDVTVTGVVNGIDLKRISESLLLKDGDQLITGNKVLRGNVTIRGDIDLEYVNGMNWKAFLNDIVRIDVPQVIQSHKTFTMETEINNAFVGEANIGMINGKNLEEFLNDVVFIDVPTRITGHKEFRRDAEITGNLNADLINGLRLKEDVITVACDEKSPPQIITGEKTFDQLTVYGDIHVNGLVNSNNLFNLYQDTLLTEGDQTVLGTKTLKEVNFLGNVFPETVNGMKLQRDLVTLHTDQIIEGPLAFDGDVFVGKDLWVHGLINGINLTKMAEEAVYLHTNETIEGNYVFQNVIAGGDVVVEGLVNNINLPAFDRNVDNFWRDTSQSLQIMDKHSRDSCDLADYLQDVLSKSYFILDGFVLHQEFDYPASFLQIKSAQEIALVHLSEPSGATAVFHAWNVSSYNFSPFGEQTTRFAKILVQKIGSSEVIVSVGIQAKDSVVNVNGDTSGVPGGFKDAAILSTEPEQIIIALLFPAKGACDVYRVTSDLSRPNLNVESYDTAIVGKEATSIALFKIENAIHLAVSRFYDSHYAGGFNKIYIKINEGWQHLQNIATFGSSCVKHFFYHNYHYLAFTNNAPVYETREPKSIKIYRNAGYDSQSFILFQKIIFDDAKGMEIFEYGDLSDLHLTVWNETRIQVYRLQGESGFKDSFTINGKCIKDVKVIEEYGEVYLIVGQQNLKNDEPVSSVLYKGVTKGVKYSPQKFQYC